MGTGLTERAAPAAIPLMTLRSGLARQLRLSRSPPSRREPGHIPTREGRASGRSLRPRPNPAPRRPAALRRRRAALPEASAGPG